MKHFATTTTTTFERYWNERFPDTVPDSVQIQRKFPGCSFRIYSLPEAKRYPETTEEWNLLLDRHNQMLTRLIGRDQPFFLVVGEYETEGFRELCTLDRADSIRDHRFLFWQTFDLAEIGAFGAAPGSYFHAFVSEAIWTPGTFDPILRDIAEDQLRALFVSVARDTIVAPYDGGMDVFVPREEEREQLKEEYRGWMPEKDAS